MRAVKPLGASIDTVWFDKVLENEEYGEVARRRRPRSEARVPLAHFPQYDLVPVP